MPSNTQTFGLILDPEDVLFFRDGRPFNTEASNAKSTLPLSQTFAGAMRTALLRINGFDPATKVPHPSFKEFVGTDLAWIADLHFRGPWLAELERQDPSKPDYIKDAPPKIKHIFVPVPSILKQVKKDPGQPREFVNLAVEGEPLECGGVQAWASKPEDDRDLENVEGYVSVETARKLLRRTLTGAAFKAEEHLYKSDSLYGFDRRTGIGIEHEKSTAKEGLIYSAHFLALKSGIVFYAEVEGDKVKLGGSPDNNNECKGALSDLSALPFGGEGKRVRVTSIPALVGDASPYGCQDASERRVMLTTPWLPGLSDSGDGDKEASRHLQLARNANATAISIAGVRGVSGYRSGQGPLRTRFLIEAGSVFQLKDPPEKLSALAGCQASEDERLGYGCIIG